jgi:hydroxymethylglutaryl-CoA reductase
MASKTMAKFAHVLQDAKHITERVHDAPEISIENFIGYISVPVGLAGPLLIKALMAPVPEPTLQLLPQSPPSLQAAAEAVRL